MECIGKEAFQQYIATSLYLYADNKRLTISYDDFKNRVFCDNDEPEEDDADKIIEEVMRKHGLKFGGKEETVE